MTGTLFSKTDVLLEKTVSNIESADPNLFILNINKIFKTLFSTVIKRYFHIIISNENVNRTFGNFVLNMVFRLYSNYYYDC